jgi:formaldehyde-activating enzyme involved in methanogenesis
VGHFKPAGAPESSAGGTSQAVLTEMTLDSDDDDTMTLASPAAHVKPTAKRSFLYKYNYNGFMQDCTKLETAVQNRPQVAKAVHGTIVTLLRIAQGRKVRLTKKLFMRLSKAPTQHLEQNDEFILV